MLKFDLLGLAQVQEAPLASSSPPATLQELREHPDLVRGQLENGLRYAILPNRVPPNRFEAHLEIHAGPPCRPQHTAVPACL